MAGFVGGEHVANRGLLLLRILREKLPTAGVQARQLWPYVKLRRSRWQNVEAHGGKFSPLSLSEHVVYSRQLA